MAPSWLLPLGNSGPLLPFWFFSNRSMNRDFKKLELQFLKVDNVSVAYEGESPQSCPTLCDPMDCSLPGSSLHGILQARILEGVAISFFRGSSWCRDQTHISCIGRQILYLCATWEAQSNHISLLTWEKAWSKNKRELRKHSNSFPSYINKWTMADRSRNRLEFPFC